MQFNKKQTKENKLIIDDEISILDIFKTIKRKKNLFLIVSFISLFISFIYSVNKKKIWKGEFEIVIETQLNNSSKIPSALSNQIMGLINIDSGMENSLKTQVKILESPSVLMEAFKFVKDQKKSSGINVSRLSYQKWLASNLDIKLFPDTSVLKIVYFDEDKNIIIPTLNNISSSYKNYSTKEKENSIEKSLKYFDELLVKMKIQSKESMLKFQDFATKHNMDNIDNLTPSETNIGTNSSLIKKSNNEIPRYIDSVSKIRKLEEKLIATKTIYKDGTQPVESLKSRIKNFKEYIARPQEIILKHRELRRNALRDESVLSAIESQVLNLKFDKARDLDSWELVSTPTLFDFPVGPDKKTITFIGGLFGIILGSLSSLIYEKSTGKIFKKDIFIDKFNFPLLKTFYKSSKEEWDKSIELLLKGNLKINNIENLGLIRLNEEICEEEEYIFSIMKKQLNNKKIVFTNNLIDSINCKNQIIIVSSGGISEKKLFSIIESFKLQGVDIIGWIYIDD